MMKYAKVYTFFLMFVFCTFCKGQNKTDVPKDDIKSEPKNVITYNGPNSITRNIIQDRKGNLWMASWEGVFRYDTHLQSFTNITSKVSSARFFSVLEDRKGNMWFGTIGSGVYYYDGTGFRNFTTKDGLVNNEVVWMYEDKIGNIWFGAFGGASRYDGKSLPVGQAGFRNYIISGESMMEDRSGKTFPNSPRQPYEVNAIIEDKTGKFWFATRGHTYVYDARLPDGQGKTFTVFRNKDGKSFTNVRTLIEDRKGNIWLGGNDGLWRYDGSTFTNFTTNFVGYIYEDKNGNIWTSSASASNQGWSLSRYEAKSLYSSLFMNSPVLKPTVTEIKSNGGMIFGILEAHDGSIWFGNLKGVNRYDGKIFYDFKGKENMK